MNAKSFFALLIVFSVLLSACAAAATPTTMNQAVPAYATAAVGSMPQPPVQLPAPAPTQAPMAAAPAPAQPAAPPVNISQAPAGQWAYPPPATPTQALPFPGTVPTPVDNFFNNPGVNPFVDTREDHLSTFSLDVDTASYTVARSYIMGGNLPPADAIRVEEFINYFNQGYPSPENIAFGIYADGAPSPFQPDGTMLLRFGVQGYQVPEWERKPLVLTFVIDVSGSMGDENRLELVKQSLQLLVDRLRPDDSVAMIAYTTDAWVVLYPTSGQDRNTILNAIYSLYPMNSTNVEAGLKLGYQTAMQAYRMGATNRVILASDGVANEGVVSPDGILDIVGGYVKEGVNLTAVGVGMGNFNDALLERLADRGNGNYAYVDTIDEARKIFVEDLTSTMQVIAMNAKVQVDFNTDVVARYRLIGYENRAVADQDFRNNSVDAGEIGAGHSATAVYAVQLRPGGQGRIATVQLRWEDPQSRQVQEINGNFNTWDLASSFNETSPRYQLAVLATQYAEVLRRSPWSAGTSMSQLSAYASQVGSFLSEDKDVVEFANLVNRACQIIGWGR